MQKLNRAVAISTLARQQSTFRLFRVILSHSTHFNVGYLDRADLRAV